MVGKRKGGSKAPLPVRKKTRGVAAEPADSTGYAVGGPVGRPRGVGATVRGFDDARTKRIDRRG